MKMAFNEKIPRSSLVDATIRWFVEGDVMASNQDREFMRQAIKLTRDAGIVNKTGCPFDAVIVKDGNVIAAAGNSVIKNNYPDAHAEVNAIRIACRTLDNWDLSGYVMYSSCECCPMCYSTAYWANIRQVFYAASWSDYEDLFPIELLMMISDVLCLKRRLGWSRFFRPNHRWCGPSAEIWRKERATDD